MEQHDIIMTKAKQYYQKTMTIFMFLIIFSSVLIMFFYILIGLRNPVAYVPFFLVIVGSMFLYFDARKNRDTIDDFYTLYAVNKVRKNEEKEIQ